MALAGADCRAAYAAASVHSLPGSVSSCFGGMAAGCNSAAGGWSLPPRPSNAVWPWELPDRNKSLSIASALVILRTGRTRCNAGLDVVATAVASAMPVSPTHRENPARSLRTGVSQPLSGTSILWRDTRGVGVAGCRRR